MGALNSHGTGMAKDDNVGWKNGSSILPADTVTDVEIDATMDSGSAMSFTRNDDTDGMATLPYIASAHYMVHSSIKYWNGATINWTLQNSSNIF